MLQKIFAFNPQKMSLRTEIFAGITTFLTMSYILAVHPGMLAETGMDKGALFTTTAVSAAFGTFLMAFIAKLPLGLAPGMGMNAMFTYTVCLMMGYSWHFALTAVFLEGIVFLLLTIFNLWDKIENAIPETLKTSIASGIGIFITFIGLKNAGIIVGDSSTLVRLGDLTSASPLLAFIGIILTTVLYIRRVPGSLLFGILITAIIGIPMGLTHFDGFFNMPPSMKPIVFQMDWSRVFSLDMFFVLLSLLFVDLFGTLGTILGLKSQIPTKTVMTHFSLRKVFCVSSLAVLSGAVMGTSAVITFIESATGVKAGGRSGITALVTGCCFLLSLFLAPFFLSIPSAATTPVLVLVGLMMLSNIIKIDFCDFSEALPSLFCILMMTLSFSIADGIIIGHLTYVAINLLCGNKEKLSVGMYVLAVLFILKYLL